MSWEGSVAMGAFSESLIWPSSHTKWLPAVQSLGEIRHHLEFYSLSLSLQGKVSAPLESLRRHFGQSLLLVRVDNVSAAVSE